MIQPILVVEDSEPDAIWFKHILRVKKVINEVVIVGTVREALAYLYRRDQYTDLKRFPIPVLMVIDVRLPDQDGHTLVTHLRNRALNVPSILVSASEHTTDPPLSSFLQKPLKWETLLQAIGKLDRLELVYRSDGILIRPARIMPGVGENVIVACATFRCLGYFDGKVWRNASRHEELFDVVDYEPL